MFRDVFGPYKQFMAVEPVAPTIDSVISDISIKIQMLDQLENSHYDAALLATLEATAATERAKVASAESDRAHRLAAKFRELIS